MTDPTDESPTSPEPSDPPAAPAEQAPPPSAPPIDPSLPAYGTVPPTAPPPYGASAVGPYGTPVPAGMYVDPHNGLVLPNQVVLAPVGRRVGAFFLSIPLAIVTLGIGYLIWGAIVWGKGTSPALQVLGMRAWSPERSAPASWGRMALRNIVGGFVQAILSLITYLISFILFLSGKEHQSIPDHIGGTVIVHDPHKVLP
jgi:uncharacterized RDD family membrane protein YckC